MIDLFNLVKNFLEEEKLPLRSALSYAALGLSEAVGAISKVVVDINFNKHAYNEERKETVVENLGLLFFCAQILAYTCGVSFDEITRQFINEYLIKNKLELEVESRASMIELMKHIKTKLKMQSQFQQDREKTNGT